MDANESELARDDTGTTIKGPARTTKDPSNSTVTPSLSNADLPSSDRAPTVLKPPKESRSRSRSPIPKVTRFDPDLPSLPTPSAAVERKRKASSDIIAKPLSKEVKLSEEEAAPPPQPTGANLADIEFAKKKQNAITRTIWTLVMIAGFVGERMTSYSLGNRDSFSVYRSSATRSAVHNMPRVRLPGPGI